MALPGAYAPASTNLQNTIMAVVLEEVQQFLLSGN
jgi:hypothetical protein